MSFKTLRDLVAYKAKCKVYFRGVGEEDQHGILRKTGFYQGKLPFKYLGMPLESKNYQ